MVLRCVWLVIVLAGSVAPAAERPWPPLRSTLSADLTLLDASLPPLPVTVTTVPLPGGGLQLQVAAEEPRLQLRARLALSPDGTGEWEIEQGRLDVSAWWSQLATAFAPDWADLGVSGTIQLEGKGRWTEQGPVGPLRVAWTQGSLEQREPAIKVEGFEAALELSEWAGGTPAGKGAIRFERAEIGQVELRRGSAAVLLRDGSLTVGPSQVDGLDGHLTISPIAWTGGDAAIRFDVEVTNVAIAALAELAPQVVQKASGTMSGRATLRWHPEEGLEPVGGQLSVDAARPAELTLAPQPGFFTDQVPPRYRLIPARAWLPRWLDRLAQRWAPENPAYRMLEGIELGRVPLRVQRLQVEFYPPDDPLGRSARLEIRGRPTNGEVVEQVAISINVSGPLAQVVRLGLQQGTEISGSMQSR